MKKSLDTPAQADILGTHSTERAITVEHYISLTIGRNVGDEPMSVQEWSKFQNDCLDSLGNHVLFSGVIFDGFGLGLWGDDREESRAYIVLAQSVGEPALRAELSKVAKKYNQEAVGLAILPLPTGSESLVYASE